MKILKKDGSSITIPDDSKEAAKIKDGYKFKLEKGKLKILSTLDTESKFYKLKQIESKSWEEAKPYLIDILI